MTSDFVFQYINIIVLNTANIQLYFYLLDISYYISNCFIVYSKNIYNKNE